MKCPIQLLRDGRTGRDKKPPNIVWICADDFTPTVSGTYGSTLAHTPNLDRLAKGGIRFDRCYCTCPLSTPSRMSFLTGRYPRSVGVTLCRQILPSSEDTIGAVLREAGYRTLALGKTHYYRPLLDQFDRCVDLPEQREFLANKKSRNLPFKTKILGPWRPFSDPASVWLNAECLPYSFDDEMPDTFFTEQAVQFLQSRPETEPFFLWVGFYVTHSPFRFPIEFQGLYHRDSFAAPVIGPGDKPNVPLVFQDLTRSDKQGIRAAYHTSVAYLDRNVGMILDAIDRAELADNTLVIFNSDHGYLLGEHGLFEKHCCYEEAVRTALLMRYPRLISSGRSSSALIELIDLVPTILDLCGIQIAPRVQGKSLLDLLQGTNQEHKHHVITEYADNAEAMVRTRDWKFIYSAGNRHRKDGYARSHRLPGPTTRLFNLKDDPGEFNDVSCLPVNQELIRHFLSLMTDHMVNTKQEKDTAGEQEDRQQILNRLLLPC